MVYKLNERRKKMFSLIKITYAFNLSQFTNDANILFDGEIPLKHAEKMTLNSNTPDLFE